MTALGVQVLTIPDSRLADAKRSIRGDLIEVFKLVRGISRNCKLWQYGQNMFMMSRSNLNMLFRGSKVSNLRKDFFSL